MRAGIFAGLLGLLVGAAPVGAAVTWTCERKNEVIAGQSYIVASHCAASGTYTTGGDAIPAAALCGSSQRQPRLVMVSNTANAAGAQTFVATYDATTGRLDLATASETPAADTPLAQVEAGTPVTGFTLRVLAFCQ